MRTCSGKKTFCFFLVCTEARTNEPASSAPGPTDRAGGQINLGETMLFKRAPKNSNRLARNRLHTSSSVANFGAGVSTSIWNAKETSWKKLLMQWSANLRTTPSRWSRCCRQARFTTTALDLANRFGIRHLAIPVGCLFQRLRQPFLPESNRRGGAVRVGCENGDDLRQVFAVDIVAVVLVGATCNKAPLNRVPRKSNPPKTLFRVHRLEHMSGNAHVLLP